MTPPREGGDLERTKGADRHTWACRSSSCPCYKEGLAASHKQTTAERHAALAEAVEWERAVKAEVESREHFKAEVERMRALAVRLRDMLDNANTLHPHSSYVDLLADSEVRAL